MRGDGPAHFDRIAMNPAFSPHAWGWSGIQGVHGKAAGVFPTCVGMVREHRGSSPTVNSFPHMRGDGPSCQKVVLGS